MDFLRKPHESEGLSWGKGPISRTIRRIHGLSPLLKSDVKQYPQQNECTGDLQTGLHRISHRAGHRQFKYRGIDHGELDETLIPSLEEISNFHPDTSPPSGMTLMIFPRPLWVLEKVTVAP